MSRGLSRFGIALDELSVPPHQVHGLDRVRALMLEDFTGSRSYRAWMWSLPPDFPRLTATCE